MSLSQISLIIFVSFIVIFILITVTVKYGYKKMEKTKSPHVPFKIAITTLSILTALAFVVVEMLTCIIYFIIQTIKSC